MLVATQSPSETPFSAGTIPDSHAAVPTYPSLWRTWNSRCVVSLTPGHADDERPPGPTKELIRGSPLPIRPRDGAASPVFDEPPPSGSVRRFTMDQFQREFGPCRIYSAPTSPLRKRPSIESTEVIPASSPHPSRRLVQPTLAATATAAVPATLGRGGWRPVTGQFSLDISSPLRRLDNSSTLPSVRKPLSALDNVGIPADGTRVKFSQSLDETG